MKTDQRFQLGYGSSWHLFRMLAVHRQRFTKQIAKQVNASSISWLDFDPTPSGSAYPNTGKAILERELTRLNFLGNDDIKSKFNRFWPARGCQQTWDAIGRATVYGEQEWILIEAKANTGELRSSCSASSSSLQQIKDAMSTTKSVVGVSELKDWLRPYYQYCNRLAALNFMVTHEQAARLIYVYFCGDQNTNADCPKDEEEWSGSIGEMNEHVGLLGNSVLEERLYRVFLDIDPSKWVS